jgi:hypothetical protein
MKMWDKIAAGLDVLPGYHAILRQPALWRGNTIPIRAKVNGKYVNWFTFDMVPQLRVLIFSLMARFEGEELGQVEAIKVPAGEVYKLPPNDFQTYGVALNAWPGCSINGEVPLGSGDAFWIREGAEFQNGSSDELVLLLVALAPNAPATYIPEE